MSSIGLVPQLIGIVTEVFQADPDFVRVAHHVGAPVVEDLHPAHQHIGLLNVDPVVLQQRFALLADVETVEQQPHRDEVAIHQAVAHLGHFRAERGESKACTSSLTGMVENTYCAGKEELLTGIAARGNASHAISRGVNTADCPAGENFAAAGADPAGYFFPQLAGAQFRVEELFDQRGLRVLLADLRGTPAA